MRRLLLPLVLLSLAACRHAEVAAPPTPAAAKVPEPIRLTVVGTNDLHGWIAGHEARVGDATWRQGGLPTFAGYLANVRADNPDGVLLLDGGDLFQGTLASNLTEGEIVIQAYNHLGYTAAAVGNHEFDYGPEGAPSVPTKAGEDPLGALKARLREAGFPLMATNLYDAKTGERAAWLGNDGTRLLTLKGVKVGLVGLATPHTPQTTNPVNVAALRFAELVPETVAAAARLRAAGAEVVVAVAHEGGRCRDLSDPRDTSRCDKDNGDLFAWLGALPEGTLDALVAGHTHQTVGHFVHGVPVIETPGLSKAFGRIELFVDPATRKVLPALTRIESNVPVCAEWDEATRSCDPRALEKQGAVKLVPASYLGRPVVRDAKLEALLAPALARVEEKTREALGVTVTERLGRTRDGDSVLGSTLADLLRDMEQADVVLLNSGGLRADVDAGPLTYGEVFSVLPFDNTVATVTVTGEQLGRLVDATFGARVYQQSGLVVTLDRCEGPARLKAWKLASGKKVRKDGRYRVVVPDFLARGGEGLKPVLDTLPPGSIDLGEARPLNLRDALVEYLKRRGGQLAPARPGRLAWVGSGKGCPDEASARAP